MTVGGCALLSISRSVSERVFLESSPSNLPPARTCLLKSGSRENAANEPAAGQWKSSRARMSCAVLLLVAGVLHPAISAWAAQAENPTPPLPEAPQPQNPTRAAAPCQAVTGAQPVPCPPQPTRNRYERFINGPQVKPLTPKEKARLAMRNVLDPFNGLTILADAGVAVGSDADSAYGPGMTGFGRYVGVSYTQDITGEFFGTFLIPSIVHQDPHYHRTPTASIPRRVGHAIVQVVWTQGDNAKGMVNYANVVGFAIDDEIGNLYVPGQKTNLPSSSERYGVTLATAPADNLITEFLPDLARRIHVRAVLFQWIINQAVRTGGAGSQ